MMRREEERQRVRELLRRGDPAADGCDPDTRQLARMRRRILDAAPPPPLRGLRPFPALALSALVVMLVAVGWNLMRPAVVPAQFERQPVAGQPEPGSERRTRQLQFSTPGGTRVVWILDSDFGV